MPKWCCLCFCSAFSRDVCFTRRHWVWAERRAESCWASLVCTQRDGERYFHGFIYMDALCFAPLSTFGLKICMFCFHTTNKLQQSSLTGESKFCVFNRPEWACLDPSLELRWAFTAPQTNRTIQEKKTCSFEADQTGLGECVLINFYWSDLIHFKEL